MVSRELPPLTGVDENGYVVREGHLRRIQPEFANVVAAFARATRAAFGPPSGAPPETAAPLHSLYLYGSIPRGTAQPGSSDFDGHILLRREPTDADRALVGHLETDLAAKHCEVSSVGILLDSVQAITDPAERHNGGFHLRILCTPLWGPDAGELIAPHRVDTHLALGVQTGWQQAINRLRSRAEQEPADDAHTRDLCRATGRRLARVAFAWVAPRWGGWTSDPDLMRRVVTELEPGWARDMDAAVKLGWHHTTDLTLARHLLEDWARGLNARSNHLGPAQANDE